MKKINIFLLLATILLTSCQSIKDGLSGKKNDNSDEFLVKKKNPLVMPPKFMELPKPTEKNQIDENIEVENDLDIRNILDIKNKPKDFNIKSGSIEDFVLDQIKNKQ